MDNFDLKKFLKESKALENLNPSIKALNEGEAAYEYEKGEKEGEVPCGAVIVLNHQSISKILGYI